MGDQSTCPFLTISQDVRCVFGEIIWEKEKNHTPSDLPSGKHTKNYGKSPGY